MSDAFGSWGQPPRPQPGLGQTSPFGTPAGNPAGQPAHAGQGQGHGHGHGLGGGTAGHAGTFGQAASSAAPGAHQQPPATPAPAANQQQASPAAAAGLSDLRKPQAARASAYLAKFPGCDKDVLTVLELAQKLAASMGNEQVTSLHLLAQLTIFRPAIQGEFEAMKITPARRNDMRRTVLDRIIEDQDMAELHEDPTASRDLDTLIARAHHKKSRPHHDLGLDDIFEALREDSPGVKATEFLGKTWKTSVQQAEDKLRGEFTSKLDGLDNRLRQELGKQADRFEQRVTDSGAAIGKQIEALEQANVQRLAAQLDAVEQAHANRLATHQLQSQEQGEQLYAALSSLKSRLDELVYDVSELRSGRTYGRRGFGYDDVYGATGDRRTDAPVAPVTDPGHGPLPHPAAASGPSYQQGQGIYPGQYAAATHGSGQVAGQTPAAAAATGGPSTGTTPATTSNKVHWLWDRSSTGMFALVGFLAALVLFFLMLQSTGSLAVLRLSWLQRLIGIG